jgi:two-component system response regulator LytT
MTSKSPDFLVLVVEDEKTAREELVAGLNESREFHVVGSADSIASAIKLASELSFDVIFLDIKLLDGTGFQFIERLKKIRSELPPIVICTGHREYEYAEKMVNEYGDCIIYLLQKPFWEKWTLQKDNIIDALYLFQRRILKKDVIDPEMLGIKIDLNTELISFKDLIMLQTNEKGSGKVEFVTSNTRLVANVILSKAIQKLPSNFIQVNRRTIVNMHYVKTIMRGDWMIIMKNGELVDVGIRYQESLKKFLDAEDNYGKIVTL